MKVEEVLEHRRHRTSRALRTAGVLGSVLLHTLIVGGLAFAPRLFAERRAPLDFVAVKIVPLSALEPGAGEGPVPRRPPSPPEPAPQEPPPPEPAPEEEADDRPVLPSPEPPEKEEPPPPEPETEKAESGRESSQERDGSSREAPDAAESGDRETGETDLGLAREGASGVAGFDDPDFTYSYYVDRMLSAIRSNWHKPDIRAEVEAIVHFRIGRNGTISDLELVKSSGFDGLDLASLRAIQMSSPLPPLPRSYRRASLGVNVIFRYP